MTRVLPRSPHGAGLDQDPVTDASRVDTLADGHDSAAHIGSLNPRERQRLTRPAGIVIVSFSSTKPSAC